MNIPDGYRFLLIDNSLVKLFRSYDGGFAIGEQWMLNSGCTKIIYRDDYYQVYGYSDSMYYIRNEQGHLNRYTSSVYRSIIKKLEEGGVPVKELSLQEAIEYLEEDDEDY
jgi:hypothetical protein